MKRSIFPKNHPSIGGVLAIIVAIVAVAYFYIHARNNIQPVYNQPKRVNLVQSQNQKSPSYYVAPYGVDTNDGKTTSHPLKTINLALSKTMPGDIVQLLPGSYYQNVRTLRDGSKEKPIIIRGSSAVKIYGARNAGRVIQINHSFIWLEGFEINGKIGEGNKKEDFQDKLIYIISSKAHKGVEGIRLNRLLVQNAGGECVRMRYLVRNNEISNSTIKHCGIYDFSFHDGGKNGEGIYLGTAPEQLGDGKNPTADKDTSNNNWIHGNIIQTFGNECVDIKEAAHDNLVEGNSCSDQQDPESGGMDARGSSNTFRSNSIFNNKGAGVRLGGDSSTDGINNNVYKNVIKNNGSYGIKILRLPQGKVCGNEFINNAKKAIGGSENTPEVSECN